MSGVLRARVGGAWVDISPAPGPPINDGDKGDITVSGSGTVWTIDPVTATGAATSRSLADWFADVNSLKGSGGIGDDATENAAAITAAEAIGRSFVPAGIYNTLTKGDTNLNGPFWGHGRIRTSAGNKRAPWFSAVKTAPASLGDWSSVVTSFNGDLSKTQIAAEHRITGAATLGTPTSGYLFTNEAYPFVDYLYNASGHNESLSSNDGRTTAVAHRTLIANAGQGDCMGYSVSGVIASSLPGATNFLANPAASAYVAGLTAGVNGCYLNPGEFLLQGGAFDVSAIGWVINLDRDTVSSALNTYWGGVRVQSVGTQAADDVLFASGPFTRGLTFAHATLTAAMALKADQRVYLNVTPGSNTFRISSLGNSYFEYNSGISAFNVVTAGVSALQVYSNQVIAPVPLRSTTHISVGDGITAPIATAGMAKIYVDTADGDLKIIFGDGVIKTIVVDT